MSFNVKKVSYPHKTEYQFFTRTVSENAPQVQERHNKGYWTETEIDGDRVYINYESGVIRDENTKIRCDNVSRKRSLNTITQLAACNEWEWFYTLTFNPDIVDSFDYDLCYKAVKTFFNNIKKRKAPDIKYLVVPELHKSGRYHFHGLVANTGSVQYTESSIPGVYNIPGFSYGFTTATKVKDTKRVASYITKYITKELGTVADGRHRYIASKNLERPEEETMNINREQFEQLKLTMLSQCQYFKQVKCPDAGQLITYVHVEKENENEH